MSEPPRFNGLQHGRVHVRLVAAVGILASVAIATGGLVSLFEREPSAPKSETGPALGLVTPSASSNPALELELRVREAELAAARARNALRNARQLGHDERELESFERRLEQLGIGPFESVRRDAAQPEQDQVGERQEHERRSHLRAIASPPREL